MSSNITSLDINEIVKAGARIHGYAIRSPTCASFSERSVWLKMECFQPVRSFKIRGAANKILSMSDEELNRGVITASSGNHGLAVAFVANRLHIKATIVLPENVVPEKLEIIEFLGARTVFHGRQQDERMKKAEDIQKEENLSFVPPFNDLQIITGQATCGMELIEDQPELENVYVPIGGGGLISGVSSAIKLNSRSCKIIGVQPEGSASMYQSWKSGRLSSVAESHTIADGLSVRKPGDITFLFVLRYVDEIVLVSDEEIINATKQLLFHEHVLVEPSGAAALAGLLHRRRETGKVERSAAIVSGGNISKDMLGKIVS